jgi:hypothetical protein
MTPKNFLLLTALWAWLAPISSPAFLKARKKSLAGPFLCLCF